MEILVLGPAAVKTDGRSLELRDRKGVGLLAYLATEGRTSRDKLADLLWTDMNQTDARRNLRQRLYELKGKLPDGCLNTDGDTVGLEPSAQTDLAQFRAHIANGDDEAAITLWRGAFLHGLELPGADGFEEWLEPMREALNTAYHEALRRLATAREERGDLRGALEAHQRLLEDDELQEHHQRETIRLLEALGERENALRQYESYRQTLEQELGDVPLPQTQQLAERVQHAIRRTTDAPITAEPDALSLELRSPLIGREADWTRLERAPHGLSLIAGEPGIGKSRLADELAFYMARHGAVRRLQGREGSSGSPLYPVAESLREALREPAWVQTLEPVWRVECARLVPEIDPQATPQPMPSLEGRVRFIEGLARALIASVSDDAAAGGVIVLDDLHWFDAATLELVGHLARRARDANVRLIATARTEELERNEAAAPILADLKRDGLLTRLDLEPLGERDVRSLIQSLSGGRDAPAFAKRLHSATVGNPFFLLETLRDLFGSGQLYVMADGTWTTPYDDETENYAELPIPATVRETVIARVDRTGADARRLLEAASLAGDGFDLALVSSATALTEWEGVEAIERAVNAELLEPVNDGYRFNHDLIQRALEDGLNPDRKKLIHRKLAVSLETANGQPARIAEHFEQGGQVRQAAPWRVKAAEEATHLYAYHEAQIHYDKALDNGLDNYDAFAVTMSQAKIHKSLDNPEDIQICIDRMLTYAKELSDPNLILKSEIFRTEILIAHGNASTALGNIDTALKLPNVAESNIAHAMLMRGLSLDSLGRFEEALECFFSVLTLKHICDFDVSGRACISISYVYRQINDIEKSEYYCEIARGIFEQAQDWFGISRVLYLLGLISEAKKDYIAAENYYLRLEKLAEKIGSIEYLQISQINLAKIKILLGDFTGSIYVLINIERFGEIKSSQRKLDYMYCLASAYLFNHNFAKAYEICIEAEPICASLSNADSRVLGNIILAACLINMKRNLQEIKPLILDIKKDFSNGIGQQYTDFYSRFF